MDAYICSVITRGGVALVESVKNKKDINGVSELVSGFGAALLTRAKSEIGLVPVILVIGAIILFK